MNRRKLGSTNLHLTTIGFGTWAICGDWLLSGDELAEIERPLADRSRALAAG